MLKPRLRASLPVRIASSDLYFGIRALRDAEANRWFDFAIEPPTDPSDPPDGDAIRRSPFA